MTPKRKLTKTISQSFFDFVMQLPTLFPMGVMAVSAPRVKNAMPMISIAAPVRKDMSILLGIGEMVKQSTITISVIGSTEERASLNLSRNKLLLFKGVLLSGKTFKDISFL